MLKKIIASIALGAFLFACKTTTQEPVVSPTTDVIVINEGNFNSADGSLSTYRSGDGAVELGIFERINGFPLAATIQNVYAEPAQNRVYAVTNAPDKLEIMNYGDFGSVSTIRNRGTTINFTNPYAFAAIGNTAYVSNWGTFNNTTFAFENGYISKINLTNNSVSKITRTQQPQDLKIVNNNLYIANTGGTTVSVLNTNNETSVAEITTPAGADKMVVDKNNKIWVLCTSGNLIRINPVNNTVETTFNNVLVSGYNEKMVLNATKDRLYWLNASFGQPTKVFAMDITATTIPTTPLITRANVYGLGVHPNGDIYVADAANFQGNGRVYVYNNAGIEKSNFGTGRGPNGFIFR
ncbi:MAG: hypothetical protein EAZ06_07215 [Cytophagales bacterium]|nr:MAG: hypothetical protein EAZ06_07215 [Cytophagales bacterium]